MAPDQKQILDKTLLLDPAFYGEVERYRAMALFGKSVVVTDCKFNKRMKSAHRMTIADVHGILNLTLPVGKPESLTKAKWSDINLSEHGQWWHVHRVALESAYGRTPYFEFLIDRFLPFMNSDTVPRFKTLLNLLEAIEKEICSFLMLPPPGFVTDEELSGEKIVRDIPQLPPLKEYYQVRGNSLGFIPDLSILDLIFNLGPEAIEFIRE